MSMSATPVETTRALPYVSGHSRRVKAAPTALTATTAAMMCASGVFSTEGQVQRFRPGRFIAAIAVALTAATLAIAGDQRPAAETARGSHLLLAQSDALYSLGVGDYTNAGELAALAPAAAPAALDSQDQFEIARMFRRAAGAR
jgi:hypothetical protein